MSHISYERINILRYNTPISLRNILQQRSIKWQISTVGGIIHSFSRRINVSLLKTLSIAPRELEQINIRYTEKWIKRIDENFIEYNKGTRPSLNIPPTRNPPRNISYLSHKFYSGDVSGMIAESLFIYLLDKLGVDVKLVGHLRPVKGKNRFTPDFIIWDDSPEIQQIITSRNYKPPAYAEVKGSTSNIAPDRLYKALLQLNKLIIKQTDCGIVFFAFKNPVNLNYEAIILEVIA